MVRAPDPVPPVIDNVAESRFETQTSAGTALLEYTRSEGQLALNHTEVPRAARERGTGSRLVEAAFLQARERGLKVIPYCPFVRAYVERHPEVTPLVKLP
jgi:predicted GNAT family acetyltransferase